jgi:hypothetical protein
MVIFNSYVSHYQRVPIIHPTPCSPALQICSFRDWHPSLDALDILSVVHGRLEAVLFPAGRWFSSNCFDLRGAWRYAHYKFWRNLMRKSVEIG